MAFRNRTVQGQLAATAGALLTAGANVTIIVTKIVLFGEEADTDIQLYVVPNAGSAGPTNEVYRNPSIGLGETVSPGLTGIVLYNGQSLQGVSDTADRINYVISYSERTGE
jgi:hypothetical protein